MFCTHMYVGKLRKMPSWRASHAARNHLPPFHLPIPLRIGLASSKLGENRGRMILAS